MNPDLVLRIIDLRAYASAYRAVERAGDETLPASPYIDAVYKNQHRRLQAQQARRRAESSPP